MYFWIISMFSEKQWYRTAVNVFPLVHYNAIIISCSFLMKFNCIIYSNYLGIWLNL